MSSTPHIKQKCCVTCVNGSTDSRALYVASSESCQPNRDLFGVWKKLKESIFNSKNQINSVITTRRTWVFPKEWIRTWPNTALVSEWKKCDESLPFLGFRRDVAFKGRQIIPEPYRNSKYPIRRLLWWDKKLLDSMWTQAYSEPLQASKMECFAQTATSLKSLARLAKTPHLRCLKGFWISFCWKTRQV